MFISYKFMKKILILFEIILLGVLLYWRLQLGINRYFDIDEFAHLHWGYSFLIGERPYSDFFYLFPPFFLIPIAAIIKIFGRSVSSIIAARVFIFSIFITASFILYLLATKLRGRGVALLTVIIFAFLPLPYDKMLEIRPDLVATMLSLMGVFLFVKAYGTKNKALLFSSGLIYSTSLAIVPKTIFFLAPVAVVMAYFFIHYVFINRVKKFFRIYLPFFIGLIIPVITVLIMLIYFGKPGFGIYSMTKMSSRVTDTLGHKFFMLPNIFFYPNDTYYAMPGISPTLKINLVIYLASVIFAIARLMGSLAGPDDKKNLQEFLMAGAFMANLYAFVKIYPLKHAQYLITLAPFVAIYFADFWTSLVRWLSFKIEYRINRPYHKTISIVFTLIFLTYIGILGKKMYQVKIKWVNTASLDKVKTLLTTLPRETPVFDLTGESIFFPNGYYFCCLPYGQYNEALDFNLPNIERDFEKKNTRYVFVGNYDRLGVLPDLQAKYIRENFVNYLPDWSLLVKKEN